MQDVIRQIFVNLDCWRHLPNYQLERRFDIFITPYLRRIVEATVGVPLNPIIIPEMPLKQLETNHTDKADYILFSQDGGGAFVIELKTDCASVRDEQIAYLARASANPWAETLDALKSVIRATKQRRKYIHLLRLLERAGQVQIDPCINACFEEEGRARFRPEWVTITTRVQRVTPLFITPRSVPGLRCITFEDICTLLEDASDPMAATLVTYLQKWQCEAGTAKPETGEVVT